MSIGMRTVGFLATAGLVAAAALSASCADHDAVPGSQDSASTSELAGSIGLDLSLAPGLTLNSVKYAITGPAGFSKTGLIDVSNSTKISALIGPLPAGKGFSITLTATSTQGGVNCSGSASFDVVARQTVSVKVNVKCHEPNLTGSVLINGQLNICPTLDGLSASPAEVLVGGKVALGVTAHDSDGLPSALSYKWTSSAEGLSDDSVPNPTFTCQAAGTVTLRVTVSDGDTAADCAAKGDLKVQCTELDCSAYDNIMAALGELTADCHGTVDPNLYTTDNKNGTIGLAFDACPRDTTPPPPNDPSQRKDGDRQQIIMSIKQLLAVQLAPDLPNVLECTAGRFKRLKEKFKARSIKACPVWSSKVRLNAPAFPAQPPPTQRDPNTGALIPWTFPETFPRDKNTIDLGPITKYLPPLSGDRPSTINGQLPPELAAFKIKSSYHVEMPAGSDPNPSCGSPAECAAACAAPFPSFTYPVDTTGGMGTPPFPGAPPTDANTVLIDPDSWWTQDIYGSNQDPYNLNTLFYHQMGFVQPLPGAMYGSLARWNPCGAVSKPMPAANIDSCDPEICNYWVGGRGSTARYAKKRLQRWCSNPDAMLDNTVDQSTCLSYCGPLTQPTTADQNTPSPLP